MPAVLYISAEYYNNIHTVIKDQVYRSGQLSGSRLEEFIKNRRIKTIINLRGQHLKKDWYKAEKKISRAKNVVHFDLEFDSHSLPAFTQINELVELIQKVEKPYLIHCWRGAERAGMASALILSIEKNFSLGIVRKQFSTRYGVLFSRYSAGGQLFDQYEKWLALSKIYHSRENLLSFIKNYYIDANGNIKYFIDSVLDVKFNSEKKASIIQRSDGIKIAGWAYNTKDHLLVKDLFLNIGDEFSVKVENKIDRPDVLKFYMLEPEGENLKSVGWEADYTDYSIPAGCYNLFFEFVHGGGRKIVFNTGFELCIK